jgi:arginine/lysine/histidine transporter system substrate-binding protein
MKRYQRIVWLLVVSALVLAACASPTPAPTAQPATAPAQQPTAAPAQPTLVPTKAPPATAAPSADLQKLGSQTWKWISSTDNSGKFVTVQNPDDYTLTFSTADGTVQIKADCNTAQGTFTTDGSRMTITVGPMTMVACPPGSLSDQFIAGLGGVAGYLFSGEQLILEWKADAGQMLFSGAVSEAAPGTDPAWDRVQSSQKLIVGTAADYPPFEYYTSDLKLDGFDIALMKKIGEKLGLQVEFNDFAFEGLGSVLQLGQADVVAAATSVTPQRQAVVDFSNLYYVSTDAALAPADATLVVQAAADLADKQVGVQKGTVYETWANENVAFTSGSGGGVTAYLNADDMIKALKDKQIDVVLLGKQPALSFQNGGGVKIVGESFAKQQYALALPKNSPTLTAKINQALDSLVQDGTLLMLSKLYLNDTVAAVKPLPITPAQPAAPAACLDGLAYVEDLSYDDQNLTAPPAVQPGQAFVKSWRIKNAGTCVWTPAYRLAFTYGNSEQSGMSGVSTPLTKNVNPGETYDMSVNLVAPKDPGTYTAVWNMHNAQDAAFGESLWVAITVPGTPTVTVKPATTLDFDVKLIQCQPDPTTEKPGGITLTLQFQPAGGTTPYRYFDMDAGKEVPQTYDRPGSHGSATIVAFGVLSADGQGLQKKIQFPPSTFGPAGCP